MSAVLCVNTWTQFAGVGWHGQPLQELRRIVVFALLAGIYLIRCAFWEFSHLTLTAACEMGLLTAPVFRWAT